jgi:hypothetical protein
MSERSLISLSSSKRKVCGTISDFDGRVRFTRALIKSQVLSGECIDASNGATSGKLIALLNQECAPATSTLPEAIFFKKNFRSK